MSGPSSPHRAVPQNTFQHWKPSIILVCSSLLMLTWKYFASPPVLCKQLTAVPAGTLITVAPETAAAWVHCAAGFLLLGVIPACIVRFVFGERLRDYGIQWGNWRTWRSMALLTPCFALGGYVSSLNPSLRAAYPLDPNANRSLLDFSIHALFYFLFYLGWEFHFRGFLQFGLRDLLGDRNSVLLQTMASSLLHIGKPAVESFSSILGGILWGLIAFRTNSILSGLIQHYSLGIALDAGIVMKG